MTKLTISAIIIFAIVITLSRVVPLEYEGIIVIIAFVVLAFPILLAIWSWIKILFNKYLK